MPGPVVHLGSTVMCTHGGQATPTTPFPRVTVSGQPVVTLTSPYTVAGCPLPSNAGGPCVTAQWIVGTTRVTAGGAPLVIQGGTAICAPTGVPLMVLQTQPRVVAT